MGPKTPPSTRVSESGSRETTAANGSEPTLYDNGDGPGETIGKHGDDADEVQQYCGNNQTQPAERLKCVYGIHNATRKAHDQWLRDAANIICSGLYPKVEQTYRDHALRNGLHEKLGRAILIHDIEAADPPVQRKLAQHILFLYLNLEKDHSSFDADIFIESHQDELLEYLQLALPIPESRKRTKRDEAQLTSLIRALLELSGGRVDPRQHGFADEYTAGENAGLYASLFAITSTNPFGEFNSVEMCNTLSISPVYSEVTINVQYLEERKLEMMSSLRLGFREGYLDLPSQVLNGFGFGQMDMFRAYLAYTYLIFPSLQKPGNSMPLLLTWSTTLSTSVMNFTRQLDVLHEWADSQDGRNLYEQLARDVQDSQNVEQLALTMAALMNYRRLLPDVSDHSDQPIKGCYLSDLDAISHGHLLGNSGRVAEQMVFALIRVLHSFGDQYQEIIAFLETTLDREPRLLYALDGFSDQYLLRRISPHSHTTAMVELSGNKMPDLEGDADSEWVSVTRQDGLSPQCNDWTRSASETESPTEQSQAKNPLKISITQTIAVSTVTRTTEEDTLPSYTVSVSSHGDESDISQPSNFRADDYQFMRLSGAEDQNISEILDTNIATLDEVIFVIQLSDESWEMVILKSYCQTLQEEFATMFPGSDINPNHNPIQPTAKDLTLFDYETAKERRQDWFTGRVNLVVNKGLLAASFYYAYLVEVIHGRPKYRYSFGQWLMPTYRGRVQSKGDAWDILEACLSGKLFHTSRRPQDKEATISGNVFVWEANSTGIDCWVDGMKWKIREEDDFEIAEDLGGSELLRKTISISVKRVIHHVVSYYTARDAQTLARPSQSMTLSLNWQVCKQA